MNWYKLANLWDEIKSFGPNGNIPDELKGEFIDYIIQSTGNPEAAERILKDPMMQNYYKRQFFAQNYSWSVPSKEAIDKIMNFIGSDPILEIGAGHGVWAKLLQEANATVTPTDYRGGTTRNHYMSNKVHDIDIEDLSAVEAIHKYNNYNVLMMSWPPYDEPMADNALRNFKGNKLIFIGEDEGGCTGDQAFFNELKRNWELIDEVNIPQWENIHDYLFLYVRK